MNFVWSYAAIGTLTLVAGALIAGGEPAMAELRLAEAATVAAGPGATFALQTADVETPPLAAQADVPAD